MERLIPFFHPGSISEENLRDLRLNAGEEFSHMMETVWEMAGDNNTALNISVANARLESDGSEWSNFRSSVVGRVQDGVARWLICGGMFMVNMDELMRAVAEAVAYAQADEAA